MNLSSITPVKLRVILSLCLVILSVIGVGLFTVGYNKLKTFSTSVQTVATEAQASQSSVQDLTVTKQLLSQDQDAVDRASQLVAESKSYLYQDQIISDINTYAGEAGLAITNISFNNPTTAAVGAAPAAAPAAVATPAAAPGVAGAAPVAGASPTGVKSMTASVTIKNPTDYLSMLKFIHLIEQSLFRMQISQVGISASTDTANSTANQVSSDILTIEVFVR